MKKSGTVVVSAALLGCSFVPLSHSIALAGNYSVRNVLNDPTVTQQDAFGSDVAVSEKYVAIGATRDDTIASNGGQVHLFDRSTGGLLRTLNDPTPSSNIPNGIGFPLALHGDVVLLGQPSDSTKGFEVGQAYLFDAGTGAFLRTFDDPTKTSMDGFGISVDVDATRVLIGAYGDDTLGTNVGQAHLFDAMTGNLLRTFNDPSITSLDNFGDSVALEGSRALIGAYQDDTKAPNAGQAHLFDSETGALLHTFNDPSPVSNGLFGLMVDLDGNLVAINGVERVYVFDASNGSLLRTIPNPSALGGNFGYSLALEGNLLLVGSSRDSTRGTDVGRAYLFNAFTGALLHTFDDPTVTGEDLFGSAVDMYQGTFVVGATGDNSLGTNVGQAYIFVPEPSGFTASMVIIFGSCAFLRRIRIKTSPAAPTSAAAPPIGRRATPSAGRLGRSNRPPF
jgi:hypothetical protein